MPQRTTSSATPTGPTGSASTRSERGASPGLRRYLATAFLARLADEGMSVAVLLLTLQRTAGAAQGAFILTAWMAPHVIAAPLVGAMASRLRRPRLFYFGTLGGFAAAVGAMAVLVGRAPTPVTLIVALLGGACGPVVSGGLSSLIAALLPDGAPRNRAYALDAAIYNAASVAGPAAVSVLAATVAPGPAVGLLAGAAACAAALAATLPFGSALPSTTSGLAHRGTMRADVAAGLAAVRRIRELRAITAGTCLAFVGLGGLTTTTVLLGDHRGDPGSGGVLMTAFACGALAGALVLATWRPTLPEPHLAAAALFGTGFALAGAALVPSLTACAALFAVAGLCDGPLLTATLRIRAAHAPPAARAQVFTLGAGLKITAAACGAALAGLVAALPPPVLLLCIATLQLCAGLLYVGLRRRTGGGITGLRTGTEQGEHHPATRQPSPHPRLEAGPAPQRRSGDRR
ncbi:MFS transporter [Streptomyces sp. NPDC048248]|uniref:MFS transporter n=1 Tax=Streptomyces sp. NPDC048248 TaxID=3365523 RepID=UPI00371CFD43